MKTLLDLGKELVELGERFNRMAHGDFRDPNENWFEGNWNDFVTKEQLENEQKGSTIL